MLETALRPSDDKMTTTPLQLFRKRPFVARSRCLANDVVHELANEKKPTPTHLQQVRFGHIIEDVAVALGSNDCFPVRFDIVPAG